MFLERPVPDDLEITGKTSVELAHPRDFVQKHDGFASVYSLGELNECLEPRFKRRDLCPRLLGELLPE